MSDTSAPLVSDENALDMKGKLQAGDGDGKLQAGNGNGKVNGAAEALAVGEAEEAVKVKAKVKVKEYPFWTGVRFLVITLLGFLGTINLYALRVNLSIALPCMVFINVTKNDTNASAANENVPAGCFRELTNDSSDPTKLPFVWAGGTKGLVNGFFFVGYLFFQIPSALLAKRFGAKLVMLVFMSLATASSLLQHPFAALLGRDLAHWSFIILRFFNGVGSAAFFPVYTALLAAWAPPEERSRMMGTAFAGMYFGIVLTFSSGGYICKWLGWAALFYIPGCISIVWLALWTALVANDPSQHRFISHAERDYILASQGRSANANGTLTVTASSSSARASKPFSLAARVRATWPLLRNVFTSPCVLALCVANVAFDYGGYTFLTNIPSFMDEVLFFNIEKNGVLSAIPYLLYWAVITLVGYAVDVLLSHKLLSVLLVRKATTTIGLGAPAVVVCLLALTDCSKPVFALIILSLAVSFQGFCFSGCFVNYMEVAPRYAGAIFAIGNSLGSITGFVAPFLVGWITSNHTHAEWSVAFFVCAGVMAVGALFYLIFASAEVQPWAKQEQAQEEEPAEAGVSYKAKGNETDAEASVRLTASA